MIPLLKCATLTALALGALIAAGSAQAQNMPGGHFIENWDLDGDSAVTLAELEERRGDVFASFDSNEDGYLDAEEYATFDTARANDMHEMSAQGRGRMMRVEAGMALAANDTDGDCRVSQDEFLTGAADWMTQMDRNGDGQVTGDDFRRP